MAVFLDTETTGLSSHLGDRIVEIAIVDEQGNTLFQSLLDPEIPIPFRAQQVHHISDSMVAGMPRLEDVLSSVHSVIDGQNVVIFNSPFDVSFFHAG